MTGGLLQIVAYGTQDIFLTGNPQITYFKIVYRRYTNFAIETLEEEFTGNVDFGEEVSCTLPKVGDLVHKVYLRVDLPKIDITVSRTSDALLNTYLTAKTTAYTNFTNFETYSGYILGAYRIVYEELQPEDTTAEDIYDAVESYFEGIDYETYTTSRTDVTENSYKTATDIRVKIQEIYDSTTYTDAEKKTAIEEANEQVKNSIKLIHKTYYDTYLTALENYNTEYNEHIYFSWINKLGYFIIDNTEIEIGGYRIDKHYGDWLNIWNELSRNAELDEINNKMIGNVTSLTTYDKSIKPAYSLYVPLQFWFCRHNGLSLPLVALRYNDVVIKVKFNELDRCCFYSYDNTNNDLENYIYLTNSTLYIDYVYLDGDERKKFAESTHEYLIEQLQYEEFTGNSFAETSVSLEFAHPCKELIWTAIASKDISTNNYPYRYYHTDSSGSVTTYKNPISKASIEMNGYKRIDYYDGKYYNYVQPFQHHSNAPSAGINVYSFAIYPEEHQPSGSCNMSKLSYVMLQLKFLDDYITNVVTTNSDTYTIKVYCFGYNILRIMRGMGGLAFAF